MHSTILTVDILIFLNAEHWNYRVCTSTHLLILLLYRFELVNSTKKRKIKRILVLKLFTESFYCSSYCHSIDPYGIPSNHYQDGLIKWGQWWTADRLIQVCLHSPSVFDCWIWNDTSFLHEIRNGILLSQIFNFWIHD